MGINKKDRYNEIRFINTMNTKYVTDITNVFTYQEQFILRQGGRVQTCSWRASVLWSLAPTHLPGTSSKTLFLFENSCVFKGRVHPKINILSLITHPHVIPNP